MKIAENVSSITSTKEQITLDKVFFKQRQFDVLNKLNISS